MSSAARAPQLPLRDRKLRVQLPHGARIPDPETGSKRTQVHGHGTRMGQCAGSQVPEPPIKSDRKDWYICVSVKPVSAPPSPLGSLHSPVAGLTCPHCPESTRLLMPVLLPQVPAYSTLPLPACEARGLWGIGGLGICLSSAPRALPPSSSLIFSGLRGTCWEGSLSHCRLRRCYRREPKGPPHVAALSWGVQITSHFTVWGE